MAATINNVQRDQELRIDNTQNQILDTSRNIKRLAVETEESAIATTNNLAKQRDQLNLIEKGLDNVDEKIDDAQDRLDDLDKCCGLCICPWNRWARQKKIKKMVKNGQTTDETKLGPSLGVNNPAADVDMKRKQQKHNIQEHDVNLTDIIEGDHRNAEINDNVQYASKAVSNLHAMALDMGQEIDAQNRQLDRINDKAEDNNTRLEDVNRRAQRRL